MLEDILEITRLVCEVNKHGGNLYLVCYKKELYITDIDDDYEYVGECLYFNKCWADRYERSKNNIIDELNRRLEELK